MSPQVCQQGRDGGNGIAIRMRACEWRIPLVRSMSKRAAGNCSKLFNTAEQDALLAAYRRVTFTGIIVEQVSIITGAKPGKPRLAVATAGLGNDRVPIINSSLEYNQFFRHTRSAELLTRRSATRLGDVSIINRNQLSIKYVIHSKW